MKLSGNFEFPIKILYSWSFSKTLLEMSNEVLLLSYSLLSKTVYLVKLYWIKIFKKNSLIISINLFLFIELIHYDNSWLVMLCLWISTPDKTIWKIIVISHMKSLKGLGLSWYITVINCIFPCLDLFSRNLRQLKTIFLFYY